VVAPAFVGGMGRVRREDVEGKAGTRAIGGGAHPEAVQAHRVTDDPLEPDLVAHERAAAVQTVALARLLRRGEAVLLPPFVVGVPGGPSLLPALLGVPEGNVVVVFVAADMVNGVRI